MRGWNPRHTRRLALCASGILLLSGAAGCALFNGKPDPNDVQRVNPDKTIGGEINQAAYQTTPNTDGPKANAGPAKDESEPAEFFSSLFGKKGKKPPADAADYSVDIEEQAGEKLYIAGEYAKAEGKFHACAENTKNPPLLAEKARFYEAECLRMQLHYPKAADVFAKMLNDFPSGVYREKAVALMFQIANYWLDDTREEIEGSRNASFWSLNSNYIHTSDPTKPFLDQEGRALELLTKVHIHDPTGPYSDKALYLIGYVNFYRGNYKEADIAFTQLVETQERSPLRPKAAEMAIMAKNNSTGGPEYDGQKTADALRLVQQAKASIPELVKERGDFLDRQIVAIRTQQAEKDLQAAEFYRRRGNAGAAYFYFELVMRRYPGTSIAEKAAGEKAALEREVQIARSHSDGFWGDVSRGWTRYVLGRSTADVMGELPSSTPTGRPPETSRPVDDRPKSMPEQLNH